MSAPARRPHYNSIERHTTGAPGALEDFFKHDCPAAKVEAWIDGKKVTKTVGVKAEFNRLAGNADMVPLNARAGDKCGLCGLSIDDPAWIPCTPEDVEALSK